MTSTSDHDTTVQEEGDAPSREPALSTFDEWALVIAWSRDEPWRIGQVLFIASGRGAVTFVGRGEAKAGQPFKASFSEQRPGGSTPMPPLMSAALSRYQLALHVDDGVLSFRNEGRAPVLLNGTETAKSHLKAGDVVQIGRQLVCLCCRRPTRLDAGEYTAFPFGSTDAHGIVGESPAVWQLRRSIRQVGARPDHVLLTGESGTGKDLAARAIHAESGRASAPFVVRNAATLPTALIDAELFGNTKNYPNSGMADRPGLVGQAHGGTLFLDEFAELPRELQTHLLSLLDRGEYQRLGEARTRTSSFRLIAATNRGLSSLKHDLLARLPLRIALPDLNCRREDIPLLVRQFLRRIAARGDAAALRFFPGGNPRSEPEVPLAWVLPLLQHTYRTHVRELETWLWQALLSADGELPALHGVAGEELAPDGPLTAAGGASSRFSPQAIRRCLEANGGSLELTWRALGLSSRFALMRLIKKHGIEVTRRRT